MFSKTCEYALRAVIYLAGHISNGEKLGITEISDAVGTPKHFTAKILQTLAKKGIIGSVKGPNGGFFIDSNKPIQIVQVVYAIEGDDFFKKCGLGLKHCSDKKPCPLHFELKEMRETLKTKLCDKSIQQIANEAVEKKLRLHN